MSSTPGVATQAARESPVQSSTDLLMYQIGTYGSPDTSSHAVGSPDASQCDCDASGYQRQKLPTGVPSVVHTNMDGVPSITTIACMMPHAGIAPATIWKALRIGVRYGILCYVVLFLRRKIARSPTRTIRSLFGSLSSDRFYLQKVEISKEQAKK
jgi:hypothetical protein